MSKINVCEDDGDWYVVIGSNDESVQCDRPNDLCLAEAKTKREAILKALLDLGERSRELVELL